MPGTIKGGIKAAQTNKKKYGRGFYQTIGAMGGKISRGGGFAANPELARIAGARGGRGANKYTASELKEYKRQLKEAKEMARYGGME
jgi:general stress protein YciG